MKALLTFFMAFLMAAAPLYAGDSIEEIRADGTERFDGAGSSFDDLYVDGYGADVGDPSDGEPEDASFTFSDITSGIKTAMGPTLAIGAFAGVGFLIGGPMGALIGGIFGGLFYLAQNS